MSLTLKIGTLAIRTLAKPIANIIKRNAREHERFREFCINFAQSLHRVDTRLRLGLLQDPAVIERQIARELAEAEVKRKRAAIPTVKTEAQVKQDDAAREKEKKQITEKAKSLPRIRPLSEAKAIETGANFISESFMFVVAGGVIVFEYWRSKRKESTHREDVSDRLEVLESEKEELKTKIRVLEEVLSMQKAPKPVPSLQQDSKEDYPKDGKSQPPSSKLS